MSRTNGIAFDESVRNAWALAREATTGSGRSLSWQFMVAILATTSAREGISDAGLEVIGACTRDLADSLPDAWAPRLYKMFHSLVFFRSRGRAWVVRCLPGWALRSILSRNTPELGDVRHACFIRDGELACDDDDVMAIPVIHAEVHTELALRSGMHARTAYDASNVARAIEDGLRAQPGAAPYLQALIGSFVSELIDFAAPVFARRTRRDVEARVCAIVPPGAMPTQFEDSMRVLQHQFAARV